MATMGFSDIVKRDAREKQRTTGSLARKTAQSDDHERPITTPQTRSLRSGRELKPAGGPPPTGLGSWGELQPLKEDLSIPGFNPGVSRSLAR